MPEAISQPFVMVGAREVLALMPGAVHIERQVVALEGAVNENPALAFDLAKTLIETVCKTLLRDRGHPVGDDLELPQLFRETLANLRMLPDTHIASTEVRNSLRKTLGGLFTVVQGVCELRNTEGFASHGKYGYVLPLDSVQALLVARAADAVVHFLFAAHKSYPSTSLARRLSYIEHEKLNALIDEANESIEIFDLTYRPSEVLFSVDPEAYRDLLARFAELEEGYEQEAEPAARQDHQ
jgi:hypothetical protein